MLGLLDLYLTEIIIWVVCAIAAFSGIIYAKDHRTNIEISILSLVALFIFYAAMFILMALKNDVNTNIDYIYINKSISEKLGVSLREREANFIKALDKSNKIDKKLLGNLDARYSFNEDQYLMTKNLIKHCFDAEKNKELNLLFDYYPVYKYEAKSLITKSLGRKTNWIDNPSCGTVVSSVLGLI